MVFRIRHRLSPQEYWNREAEAFDRLYAGEGRVRGLFNRLFRSDMEGRFRFVLRHALEGSGPNGSAPDVLEIGCGTGLYMAALLKRGAGQVTGLDCSPRMLEIAQKRLAGFEDRARLIEGDFLHHVPERRYDVVLAIGVFDYIAEPRPFFKKMLSCTNGIAVATFPRAGTLRSFLRFHRLALRGCAVYFYTSDALDAMAAECGAKVLRYETIGQLHCLVMARS